MNASSIAVRETWVRKYLAPPNPFYCLSAMCMMVGCYLVSGALSERPATGGELVTLMATLQVYEMLLVGLGVLLVRRARAGKGRIQDGWLLLIIEAVFIVDAAQLNAEAVAIDDTVGWVITALTLVLAAVKLGVVVRGLRLRPAAAQLVFVGLGFALVLVMPAAVATLIEPADLDAWTIYACWCALAVVVAVHGFWPLWRSCEPGAREARLITMTLAAALYLSAGLHVIAMTWVHRVDVEFAFAAPVLVALLPWIGRIGERLGWSDAVIAAWQGALPAMAVGLSVPGADRLTLVFAEFLGTPWDLDVSPFRIVLVLAALVYIALAIDGRRAWAALAAALSMTGAMMGASPGDIANTDQLGAGVLVLWFAFVLLAVGAWSSLKPHRPDQPV